MSTAELRNKWEKSISLVDDKFLQMIDALYETYIKEEEADFFDELPKEIQELLMERREDIKNGKFSTHEEVMAEVRKRYNIAG